MDAKQIIKMLNLVPLPEEGGYYIETYRSDDVIAAGALPDRYAYDKTFSTAIYFLITPDDFSAMHRIPSEEIFHFYAGDSVEMLHLYPDGSHAKIIMGNNLEVGEVPQVIVPRGIWQGCRIKLGGKYALLGTTVAPAFDFDDYENGNRCELTAQYPECMDFIKELTRD